MKIFGSWSELVSLVFRKSNRAITVEPASQTVGDATVTIQDLAGVSRNMVLDTTTQTLTNKTLTAPVLNGATLSLDTPGAGNIVVSPASEAADRTLTLDLNGASRTLDINGNLDITGNLTTAAAFTTSGASPLTLTVTGSTNVTLPTTGTLATLAGSETLLNKTLTSPSLNTPSISRAGPFSIINNGDPTYGMRFQSAGTLTTDRSVFWDISDAARNITVSGDLSFGGNFTSSSTVSMTGAFSTGAAFTTVGVFSTAGAFSTAAAFTQAGAFATTLTSTGATNVTLPTTGTLATLAGSETLTNKTIAAGSNTISGLTNSNLSGSAAISNANLATMAATTIKGNATGGSATPTDLTGAQTTALLSDFVGDSGSGGTKGLVPAPAAGDAAASKFLKADGTWATTAGGVGGSGTTGTLPKWATASTLTDSLLSESGTLVTNTGATKSTAFLVGTTTETRALDLTKSVAAAVASIVNSSANAGAQGLVVQLTGNTADVPIFEAANTAGNTILSANGNNRVFIDRNAVTNGGLTIGNATTNTRALYVSKSLSGGVSAEIQNTNATSGSSSLLINNTATSGTSRVLQLQANSADVAVFNGDKSIMFSSTDFNQTGATSSSYLLRATTGTASIGIDTTATTQDTYINFREGNTNKFTIGNDASAAAFVLTTGATPSAGTAIITANTTTISLATSDLSIAGTTGGQLLRGTAGNSILTIDGQGAGVDAVVRFQRSASSLFALGNDGTDDTWQLVTGGTLGSGNPAIKVTSAGMVSQGSNPAVHAYASANQTIWNSSGNGGSILASWTESFDVNSCFNASTGVFTVPTGGAGKYLVCVTIAAHFSTNPGTYTEIDLSVRKNGSTYGVAGRGYENTTTNYTTPSIQVLVDAAAGDTIDTFAFTNNTGAGTKTAIVDNRMISITKVA